MDKVQEIINLLRYGGFNLAPQAVVVALDDDLLKLIRAIDKMLEKQGDKLSIAEVKKLVSAFNEKKKAEAEAAEKPEAVLEK